MQEREGKEVLFAGDSRTQPGLTEVRFVMPPVIETSNCHIMGALGLALELLLARQRLRPSSPAPLAVDR